MKYELLVGLEIHAQAQTRTKMYCRCAVPALESEPNTLTCPTCLGLPGALPVPNAAALALAERASRLFGATVLPASLPERKNYSYPDLPKGYQISQFSAPFAASGSFSYFLDGDERTARIVRLQVEEDTAKLIPKGKAAALDFNRSGVPLLEIVTAPDFTDARAVGEFLRTLRAALRENGICDGRMETGSMRCEPNVSLTADGVRGQKVEIKNVGSIRAVERAVAWEARHQEESLRAGGAVRAVTKGWDERRGECVVQREKESAADYRYFPEPDLPSLVPPAGEGDPTLPADRIRSLLAADIPFAAARRLGLDRALAAYHREVVAAGASPADAASWVAGPLLGIWREAGEAPGTHPAPARLAQLLLCLSSGEISLAVAKGLLPRMAAADLSPRETAAAEGLAGQVGEADLRELAKGAIAAQPDAVASYRQGREAAAQRILGAGMALSKGRADPQALLAMILSLLNE